MTAHYAGDAPSFGTLNGHAVGTILKEAVRRSIKAIRLVQLDFQIHAKASTDHRPDYFTTADTTAQGIYVKAIQEALPGVGMGFSTYRPTNNPDHPFQPYPLHLQPQVYHQSFDLVCVHRQNVSELLAWRP